MAKIGWKTKDKLEQEKFDNDMKSLRSQRNKELKETDYTQLPDFDGDKKKWANYRRKLKDLPEKVTDDPKKVRWPKRPDKD